MGERRSGASGEESTDDRRRPWRVEARYLLHIVAAAGFAFAQPVLASFGDSPETFVAAGASPVAIVAFGIAVVLLPGLLLWALVATTSLVNPRVREVSQSAAVGLVAASLGLWALADLFPARAWVVLVSAAAGLAVAVGYLRVAAVRLYLSFASVAPVAFLVMFLAFSPASLLVFEPEPATAGGSKASGPPPSVVIVVLDELPTASLLDDANQIDAELFPNIAAFADDATFYRNHTAVAGQTQAVLPALLTGRYSTEEGAKRRDYQQNLFTAVGNSYQLNVREAVTTLCPASLCDRRIESDAMASLGTQAWKLWSTLLEDSEYEPPTGGNRPIRSGGEDRVVDLEELMADRDLHFERFLASLQPEGARPRLDFAHLLYPHQPWNRLPDGRRFSNESFTLGRLAGVWTTDTSAQVTRQRHLLQVQYADRLLGRVLDRLKEVGRYDDSYVVVLADHGISFAPELHDRDIEAGNAHEVLWAPLLVKAPGQADGSIDETNRQVIDLLPTLADAAGIEIPWEVDGRSILSDKPLPPEDKRYLPRVHGDQPDDEGADPIPVDGVEQYRRMLAEPPASAVPSDDPLALYRLPPYVDLLGTAVGDLPHGPPVEWDVEVAHRERYADVDPSAHTVPAYITGEVQGASGAAGTTRLVVSVNGVIGGWGALDVGFVDDKEPTRFGVLVPPSMFRPGANTIEVWALEGSPGAVSLRPVEGGCCVG